MTEVPTLTRTLLSAATSGLVAGTVLWVGWALGPAVDRAWAASEFEPREGAGQRVGARGAATALSSAACGAQRCESKAARFEQVQSESVEVREKLVSLSQTELQGSTHLSGPTELSGPTHLRGATEAHSSLIARKGLRVEQSLVVEGDLQVKGNLEVLGNLQIKGKMDFPSQRVSCVDTRTHDQQDKVCPIGEYGLCLPTRQSGICDLERSSAGEWTLIARNPRGGGTPSRCEAVCF